MTLGKALSAQAQTVAPSARAPLQWAGSASLLRSDGSDRNHFHHARVLVRMLVRMLVRVWMQTPWMLLHVRMPLVHVHNCLLRLDPVEFCCLHHHLPVQDGILPCQLHHGWKRQEGGGGVSLRMATMVKKKPQLPRGRLSFGPHGSKSSSVAAAVSAKAKRCMAKINAGPPLAAIPR